MKTARFVCPFVLFAFATALAQNPVPFINQPLVPTTTAPGGSSFTLTVNGTGFVSASVANWNGAPLSTTLVNSSQLTAIVPALNIATAGTASITVSSPAPGGGVSNVMYFEIANQASSLVFSSLYSSSPGSGYSYSMIAADFNGDGKLDLASLAYTPTNALVIALGNGDGTFQTPVQYPTGNAPYGLVAADFNGDGKLDVAVVNKSDNTISIFLGNGDGTFQVAKTSATGASPVSVATGDFNGDGKLDLAVNVGGIIAILLGNGDGTFQAPTDYEPGQGEGAAVDAMAVGDFNSDGKLDIALACYSDFEGAFLFILIGNGDGTFQVSSGVSMGSGPGTPQMRTADLNGDGKLDLILSSSLQFVGISVLLGNGDGTFRQGGGADIGDQTLEFVVGDFNADGKLDLAASAFTNSGNGVGIALGNGDGTFQNATIFPTAPPGCDEGDCISEALVAGDFNGDGQTDLAAAIINTGFSSIDNFQVLLQGNYAALASGPSSVVFTRQNVGTSSAPQSVTVTNTGNATYDISSISLTGANAGDFAQNNTCGAVLAANASCQANITFTPSQSGVRNAGLSVTGNSFPLGVPLTGTGVGTVASLSPPTVTFPAQYVGTSGLPQTVMLNNTGGGLLIITGVTVSPADFAPLSTCGNSLAAGASCSMGVFFDPTSSGTRTGTLIITDSASNSPQTATLTGVGQDFSMASSGSTTATVSPGGTAKYTLAIAPAGGFKQTVSFTCSGVPAGFTCSVPSSVTLNGSSTTMVTVTVAGGTSARLAQPGGFTPAGSKLAIWLALGGLPGLVIVGVSGGKRGQRRRRILCGLASVCLFALSITWTGCGGGSSGGGGGPGTYNLTVTGKFTSGATTLSHNTNLTLVVQ
jgi:hypothetical protein